MHRNTSKDISEKAATESADRLYHYHFRLWKPMNLQDEWPNCHDTDFYSACNKMHTRHAFQVEVIASSTNNDMDFSNSGFSYNSD